VIERRQIVGLDYVRVQTPGEFEVWCVENGWASSTDFTGETNATFDMLRGTWFFVTRHETRTFVYQRTASGVKAVF